MNQNNRFIINLAGGILLSIIGGGIFFILIKFLFLPLIKIAGISLIISLMLFYLLDPLVVFLERKGIDRNRAIKVMFLSSIGILIFVFAITFEGSEKVLLFSVIFP